MENNNFNNNNNINNNEIAINSQLIQIISMLNWVYDFEFKNKEYNKTLLESLNFFEELIENQKDLNITINNTDIKTLIKLGSKSNYSNLIEKYFFSKENNELFLKLIIFYMNFFYFDNIELVKLFNFFSNIYCVNKSKFNEEIINKLFNLIKKIYFFKKHFKLNEPFFSFNNEEFIKIYYDNDNKNFNNVFFCLNFIIDFKYLLNFDCEFLLENQIKYSFNLNEKFFTDKNSIQFQLEGELKEKNLITFFFSDKKINVIINNKMNVIDKVKIDIKNFKEVILFKKFDGKLYFLYGFKSNKNIINEVINLHNNIYSNFNIENNNENNNNNNNETNENNNESNENNDNINNTTINNSTFNINQFNNNDIMNEKENIKNKNDDNNKNNNNKNDENKNEINNNKNENILNFISLFNRSIKKLNPIFEDFLFIPEYNHFKKFGYKFSDNYNNVIIEFDPNIIVNYELFFPYENLNLFSGFKILIPLFKIILDEKLDFKYLNELLNLIENLLINNENNQNLFFKENIYEILCFLFNKYEIENEEIIKKLLNFNVYSKNKFFICNFIEYKYLIKNEFNFKNSEIKIIQIIFCIIEDCINQINKFNKENLMEIINELEPKIDYIFKLLKINQKYFFEDEKNKIKIIYSKICIILQKNIHIILIIYFKSLLIHFLLKLKEIDDEYFNQIKTGDLFEDEKHIHIIKNIVINHEKKYCTLFNMENSDFHNFYDLIYNEIIIYYYYFLYLFYNQKDFYFIYDIIINSIIDFLKNFHKDFNLMKIQKINYEIIFNNNYFNSSDEKIYNLILIFIINFPHQENENLINSISNYLENLSNNSDNYFIQEKFLLFLLQLFKIANEKFKNDILYYFIYKILKFHIHKFLKIIYYNNFILVENKRNLLFQQNKITQEFLETNFSNFNIKEKFFNRNYKLVVNKIFTFFDKEIKIIKNIMKNEDVFINYLKKKFFILFKTFLKFININYFYLEQIEKFFECQFKNKNMILNLDSIKMNLLINEKKISKKYKKIIKSLFNSNCSWNINNQFNINNNEGLFKMKNFLTNDLKLPFLTEILDLNYYKPNEFDNNNNNLIFNDIKNYNLTKFLLPFFYNEEKIILNEKNDEKNYNIINKNYIYNFNYENTISILEELINEINKKLFEQYNKNVININNFMEEIINQNLFTNYLFSEFISQNVELILKIISNNSSEKIKISLLEEITKIIINYKNKVYENNSSINQIISHYKKITTSNNLFDIYDEYFDINYLINFYKKKYNLKIIFNCCLVKKLNHIKGFIFLYQNSIYFISYLNNNYCLTCNSYDFNEKKCFGSKFFCPLKDELKRIKINLKQINFIFKRIYFYNNSAIEIIMNNGKYYYFNFINSYSKKCFLNLILENNFFKKIFNNEENEEINCFINSKLFNFKEDNLQIFCEKWQKGFYSNFVYLMLLNFFSNRSYSDIYNYPIFPWLFNYLELNNDKKPKLRNLNLNLGQISINDNKISQNRLNYFENKYNTKKNNLNDQNLIVYESNYSNPFNTTFYLIRTIPFSFLALEFKIKEEENNNINKINTKIFNSYNESLFYNLSLNNFIYELIPEIYFLPENLLNLNKISFKNKEINNFSDVELPEKNNYEFVYKLIKELESKNVSNVLNNWIDLIFGVKQNEFVNLKITKEKEEINNFKLFREESYINNKELNKSYKKDKKNILNYEIGIMPKLIFNTKCKIKDYKNTTIFKLKRLYKKKNYNFKNEECKIIKLAFDFDIEKNLINYIYLIKNNIVFLHYDLNKNSYEKIYIQINFNFRFFSFLKKNYDLVTYTNNLNLVFFSGYNNGKIKYFDKITNQFNFISNRFKKNIIFTSLCLIKLYSNDYIICGNNEGKILLNKIYIKNDKREIYFRLIKEKIIDSNHISKIKFNHNLNIILTYSENKIIQFFTWNKLDCLNIIYLKNYNISILKYINLISNPFPCVLINFDDVIINFTINGKKLFEINNKKVDDILIYKEKNYLDYILYLELNDNKLIIKKNNIFFNKEKIIYNVSNNINSLFYLIVIENNENVLLINQNNFNFLSSY